MALVAVAAAGGCGWEPSRPFDRHAPAVDEAIAALDAGEAGAAAKLLESYLGTGECKEGSIGVPDSVRDRHNAGFDLGLALFHMAERFGARFGEEEVTTDAGPTPEQQTQAQLRSDQVECALRLLQAIATARDIAPELVARTRYLEGNLQFLRGDYRAAVAAYDEALKIIPGLTGDAGDGIGRDAAWNRAIALRRIEEEEKRNDAGADAPDAPEDAPQDQEAGDDGGQEAGPDAGPEAGPEAGQDASDEAGNEAGSDADQDQGGDAGQDAGDDAAGPNDDDQQADGGGPDGGQPPPQSASQDDRILDMLESAPTVQLQDAKNRASRRRGRTMVDK